MLSCSLTSPVGNEARPGVVGIATVAEGVAALSLSVAVLFVVLVVEVSVGAAISVSAVFFSSEGEVVSVLSAGGLTSAASGAWGVLNTLIGQVSCSRSSTRLVSNSCNSKST